MANESIKLFEFYRRYRWRAADFMNHQQGLMDSMRGANEGIGRSVVLQGGEISNPSGLLVAVAAFIATGPTGDLLVQNDQSTVTLPSATGSFPVRHLIVARPDLSGADFITRPTNPFELVPLTTVRAAQVVLLSGTAASAPAYPAKGANDVVLAGIRLPSGATGMTTANMDLEVRDVYGKNGQTDQNTIKYDDRCRAHASTLPSLTIKPSQGGNGARPNDFFYPGKNTPSIFPKNVSANYNHADTLLNFETGAITGGDEVSLNFTPVIPTSGNSIVATIVLESDDTLTVLYGTTGTFAQCFSGIKNQVTAGAGSINAATQKYKLCYVILTSSNGTNITEMDVMDARTLGSAALAVAGLSAMFDAIMGTPAQVTAGQATHSSFATAQADTGAEPNILWLKGTFAGPHSVTKTGLTVMGCGYGTKLGDFTISASASNFQVNEVLFTGSLTATSGATGCLGSAMITSATGYSDNNVDQTKNRIWLQVV